MVAMLCVWGFLVWQRLAEVARAQRHTKALLAQGGREFASGHYPIMVLIHTLWFTGWLAESFAFGVNWNPVWLLPALLGQFLRVWAQSTLGPRWTTRVIVVPGEQPVTRGPFRFLRHPNYVGVTLELFAFPLLFGSWRTAIVCSLANAALLKWRVRCEEKAWTQFGN